jgi:hypothetical protein
MQIHARMRRASLNDPAAVAPRRHATSQPQPLTMHAVPRTRSAVITENSVTFVPLHAYDCERYIAIFIIRSPAVERHRKTS